MNFDENSFLDDYAYLAAVPTAVFKQNNKLFSHPLLFYQDPYPIKEDRERSLNARQGIDYFMEDWMSYSGGKLDQMTLVNVPKSKIPGTWDARDYVTINSDNPFDIASEIALQDWSYSDTAVVAVIKENFEKQDYFFKNETEGILHKSEVKTIPTFELTQTNSLNPVFKEFNVEDGYKYIKAETWWDCLILGGGIMMPTGDPDLQLYCKYDNNWMQSSAVSFWNVYMPPGHEFTSSYVYKPGKWRVSVTDFPTESNAPRKNIGPFILQGNLFKALLQKQVKYYVDVSLYPGVTIEIPDLPPYECRDVNFTLTWDDPNVDLGFTIVGPGGEAVYTITEKEEEDNSDKPDTGVKTVHLDRLGGCLAGEHYSISVFSLNDVETPVKFKIEYSWSQRNTRCYGACFESAANGAILASLLNAPLLYTFDSQLSDSTKNVLYKLGVKNVILIDFEDKSVEKTLLDEVKEIVERYIVYDEYDQVYNTIREKTGSNDVVFSTVDPWTKWYLGELKPGDETKAALFIGPAAYIAAHHGTPVLIVENHPRLSSAVVWHNEFWKKAAHDRYWNLPSVAEMVLTGRRIYDFLKDKNFDKPGLETIITVADQYDIGVPWDRIFPGVANSGRFCGSPVDTSYWIARSIFYPALIFENPALQGKVTLINGSLSHRALQSKPIKSFFKKPLFNTLVIDRKSKAEEYEYPVLCSFVTHKYRFNERASKFYGAKYECADGLVPGESSTMNPIDEGSIKKFTGKDGSYFPDICEIYVIPFYLKKGGYSSVFSTALSPVLNNLNQGVILWIHVSHGSEPDGGGTLFWDPENGFNKNIISKLIKPLAGCTRDKNPAWAYEWELGSTEEPDTMSMDVRGIFPPFTNRESWFLPALGQDWVLARKPLKEFLNRVVFFWSGSEKPFTVDDLYDGVIGTAFHSRYQYKHYKSTEIEENLDNLHSVGFVTSICQTSNTYFHLMIIRHGSVFQVQDPWPTSWYGTVWRQTIPRDIILGYTVGEAYTRGISHVGTLYLGGGGPNGEEPQWWWDTGENVIYFGDPELRMFVPNTKYSDANYWEQKDTFPLTYDPDINVGGHMPFGATSYPHEQKPQIWDTNLFLLLIIVVIVVILITALFIIKRKK